MGKKTKKKINEYDVSIDTNNYSTKERINLFFEFISIAFKVLIYNKINLTFKYEEGD